MSDAQSSLGNVKDGKAVFSFVARPDGSIVDANSEGWRFVERWRRESGRAELSRWLESLESGIEFHPYITWHATVQMKDELYRLHAILLPGPWLSMLRPLFGIEGERVDLPDAKSDAPAGRQTRLSLEEAEVLKLRNQGLGNRAIAMRTGLHLMKVMEIGEKVMRSQMQR